MGWYSYKAVAHRADFKEELKIFEEEGEFDNDPNYDGDYWRVTGNLLDKKDNEIKELQDKIAQLELLDDNWFTYKDVAIKKSKEIKELQEQLKESKLREGNLECMIESLNDLIVELQVKLYNLEQRLQLPTS